VGKIKFHTLASTHLKNILASPANSTIIPCKRSLDANGHFVISFVLQTGAYKDMMMPGATA